MVVTDPTIDPITGLPVLNPSGPVQQIPLGQGVFPYADLNATAQPTRGPIYGDDIIPTSGLVTAPDVMKKPRSIQSTTTRELRVREAVFQNLGAAIPDGETAPVDVNVVSGGGGGGGSKISTSRFQEWFQNISIFNGVRTADWTYGDIKTLYGLNLSAHIDQTVGFVAGNYTFELVYFPDTITIYGCSIDLIGTGTTGVGCTAVSYNVMFPLPLDLSGYVQGLTGFFEAQIHGTADSGFMTVGLVYD